MIYQRFAAKVLSFLCFVVLCMLHAISAYSQSTSLSGTVIDSAGAVAPGVSISLTGESGAERTAVSDAAGFYRFIQLVPGRYALKAEHKGFKTAKQTLDLLIDTPMSFNVHLEVGAISEIVTVEGEASTLNTQDAALGNAFEGLRIRQLPLMDRNAANLLTLQAGVTPDGSVNGSRSDQANLTLDGIDINEQQTNDWANSVLRVSPDAVQEFKVSTNISSAMQGRSAGGQISLITRTGTDNFHGSLYYSNRSTWMTANDFFNNRSGLSRPELRRDLFGGSVGGPIIKDRAFFFYNYEGRRDDKQAVVGPQVVPLPSLGQGIIKYTNTSEGITTLTAQDLNAIFPVGLNPAALNILADAARKYPANDAGVGDGLNIGGYRFNADTPLHYNAHTATMNFNLTRDGSQTLLLRANVQHDLIVQAPQFPDTPGSNLWSHPSAFAVQHTWTAGNRLVNTFRAGLTREAYSQQGDSAGNEISFRFVYNPRAYTRTLAQIVPTWNFVDDIAWVKGNHTFAFGGNVRTVRNRRTSYAGSYDSANTNPTWYDESGEVLTDPFTDIEGSKSDLQGALAAVIGRFSDYSSSFNFGSKGEMLPAGSGVARNWANEEFEMYAQDTWRIRRNFTLTLGLRYSLDRPVYEANGLEVKPTPGLSRLFAQRVASAARGIPDDTLVSLNKSGPANGKSGMYPWDKNNFAPRAAFAWQPNFDSGVLRAIFGGSDKSVIRGGFSMAYDHLGSALAVTFDLNNALGFSSTQEISANTYNVTDNPGPLFTGLNQSIRTLPGITVPSNLTFPLSQPADGSARIEYSLDDSLKTPVNYLINFSIAREFAHGLTIEAAYVGRMARNLLAQRDLMMPNNLVDTKSGMDWYKAAGILYDLRWNNIPVSQVQPIAYFENLFPDYRRKGWPTATQSVYSRVAREAAGGSDTPDWTFVQFSIDDGGIYPAMFYQPQYGALDAWSTIARSNYHAGIISIRERFNNSLHLDFNYTFSKSLDNASGLQREDGWSDNMIINALRPNDNYALSNFDMKHVINANMLWELPIGHGRQFLNSVGSVADQFFGGWQLSSIFRWNSGVPEVTPYDSQTWATDWKKPSSGVRIRHIESSPTKSGDYPNLFDDQTYAFRSFRNARAGETGDRNVLRRQGYVCLDMGLSKSFRINETHRLQFRWEIFNATNTQRLGAVNADHAGMGLNIDPQISSPSASFGTISQIQGTPRIMQMGLRYDF
jgi:hypothetical protein